MNSEQTGIDNNNVYSGTIAASYLLSQGYRKISFIGGQYYDLGSSLRLQGVKQTLQSAGIPLEDQYIWLGESTRVDGFRMTVKLLDQNPLPDAIICANNYIAVGCVDALLKKGMNIPADIGVMAFDDYPFSQIIEPQLTVVDAECEGLHPGLAGLLRDCEYEDNNVKVGRVAEKKIPLLYLETVEAPQNESEEPCEAGNAPVAGLQERELSKGILGDCRKWYSENDHYKRKTRTGRILQHP